jgi:hypothetical protein
VPAIFGALLFDHNEIRLSIDTEKVDPSPGIFPAAKFLADHQNVGCDDFDLITQQTLQVTTFAGAPTWLDTPSETSRRATTSYVTQQVAFESAIAIRAVPIIPTGIFGGMSTNIVR